VALLSFAESTTCTRLIAIRIRTPRPHAVNPTPITSAAATTATAATPATEAQPYTDAAATTATSAAVAPASVMATSAAATVTPTTMTAASAAMTAATAVADKLHHRRCIVATFFVEDVKRCQANVRDFLLTEEDLLVISIA